MLQHTKLKNRIGFYVYVVKYKVKKGYYFYNFISIPNLCYIKIFLFVDF